MRHLREGTWVYLKLHRSFPLFTPPPLPLSPLSLRWCRTPRLPNVVLKSQFGRKEAVRLVTFIFSDCSKITTRVRATIHGPWYYFMFSYSLFCLRLPTVSHAVRFVCLFVFGGVPNINNKRFPQQTCFFRGKQGQVKMGEILHQVSQKPIPLLICYKNYPWNSTKFVSKPNLDFFWKRGH